MIKTIFLIEKQINQRPYWLKFSGCGYKWMKDYLMATKFSSEETTKEFFKCMTDEDAYIIRYYE